MLQSVRGGAKETGERVGPWLDTQRERDDDGAGLRPSAQHDPDETCDDGSGHESPPG